MNISDEELIAQFAALSSSGNDDVSDIIIPQSAVKSWDWANCMVMKVMGSRVVFDTTFATALRMVWPVHPDTVTQGLGNNTFLIEFTNQEDLLMVMSRGTWTCNKDMVVTRLTVGPEDLINPQIDEFEAWVELHGIPPESLDLEGIKLAFKQIGLAMSECKSYYWAGQKVYKKRLMIDMKQPLTPKLPLKHPQLGRRWIYAVYENIANVCMFCARIGHEHVLCPAKLRLKRMQQEEKQRQGLAGKQIKETLVGKWLMDRNYVPRVHEWISPQQAEGGDSLGGDSNMADQVLKNTGGVQKTIGAGKEAAITMERGLKRPIDLNDSQLMLITVGTSGEQSNCQYKQEGGSLNYKRAKEANPN